MQVGHEMEVFMRVTRLLVVVLTALGLSLTGLSSASASYDRAPEIKNLVAYTAVDPSNRQVAYAAGTYRCWGPSDSMHLWVSVKQGGPDPTAEGSSSTVDAWYDTNISQDVRVKCDGQWHTRVVKLGQHPTDFGGRPLGLLKNGRAWLQFCMVSMADESLLASKNRWVTVVGAR
jgi:hypothetical protein